MVRTAGSGIIPYLDLVGHLIIKLVERMLTVAASLEKSKIKGVSDLIGLLWCYKCLNKASALIETKKNASST